MQQVITNPETVRNVCEVTARALATQLGQEVELVRRAIKKDHEEGRLVVVRDDDGVCLIPADQVQQ